MKGSEVVDDRHIGKKLRIISNQIKRKVEKKAASYGLEVTSAQARIIGFVYRESLTREIYQKDIEEEFDIRRSSVTNILQLLEKNGYINRVSVVEDARLKKIVLTEKGVGIHEIVLKGILEVEDSLCAIYSKEEFEQLIYLLNKLSRNL